MAVNSRKCSVRDGIFALPTDPVMNDIDELIRREFVTGGWLCVGLICVHFVAFQSLQLIPSNNLQPIYISAVKWTSRLRVCVVSRMQHRTTITTNISIGWLEQTAAQNDDYNEHFDRHVGADCSTGRRSQQTFRWACWSRMLHRTTITTNISIGMLEQTAAQACKCIEATQRLSYPPSPWKL